MTGRGRGKFKSRPALRGAVAACSQAAQDGGFCSQSAVEVPGPVVGEMGAGRVRQREAEGEAVRVQAVCCSVRRGWAPLAVQQAGSPCAFPSNSFRGRRSLLAVRLVPFRPGYVLCLRCGRN